MPSRCSFRSNHSLSGSRNRGQRLSARAELGHGSCAHETPGSAPPPAVEEAIIAPYTRPFSRMSIAGRAAVSTTAPHPRSAAATLSHALWISTEVGQSSSVAQTATLNSRRADLAGLGRSRFQPVPTFATSAPCFGATVLAAAWPTQGRGQWRTASTSMRRARSSGERVRGPRTEMSVGTMAEVGPRFGIMPKVGLSAAAGRSSLSGPGLRAGREQCMGGCGQ